MRRAHWKDCAISFSSRAAVLRLVPANARSLHKATRPARRTSSAWRGRAAGLGVIGLVPAARGEGPLEHDGRFGLPEPEEVDRASPQPGLVERRQQAKSVRLDGAESGPA